MKQTITINELWCDAIIGIYPHEREKTQSLCLTVSVDIDAQAAIAEDNIAATLDYDALANTLKDHTQSNHYQLLETLLAKLLNEIAQFDAALNAELRISKPDALAHLGATVALSGRWER
jgi:dihydroneopterin aldolase/2-amino-4-hydroxy-6-hydroxymethyldihydropteridine diphosphokinase/dihydropteroate synthase